MLAGLRIARFGQLGQGEDGHVARGDDFLGAFGHEHLQLGVELLDPAVGGPEVLHRLAQAEVDADLGQQLVVVERLDHVVVGPDLVALEPLGRRGLAADEDDLGEAAQRACP